LKQLIRDILSLPFSISIITASIVISPILLLISWLYDNKIKCNNCNTIQEKANWDYQKCSECNEYLFDDRW
jgi:Zn finger protein HypA/HybF involved in hydrogenase expression